MPIGLFTNTDSPHDNAMTIDNQNIAKLLAIMAKLRTPETGCPWGLEQNFSSIAPYTLEEAYEVTDAIERNDMDDLKEELGDLLLQVVFHAQMAEELGLFNFADVTAAISDKMIRRHPHVFGENEAGNASHVTQNWEAIKQAEKAAKGHVSKSLMDDVPITLPGLIRAVKLQKKAAKVGFDWAEAAPIFDKLQEEIDELTKAMQTDNKARIEDEYGDILFVMANLARHLGVNPEQAIRHGNNKFSRRFKWMEREAKAKNKELSGQSLDNLETLWQQAKQALNDSPD